MSDTQSLVLGAVGYDPKVITIWEGFKEYFINNNLPFDFILYSNYEHQVEDLINGVCNIAWNSPLAWLRAKRLAEAQKKKVYALAMRDTDCNLTSLIVVKKDSSINKPTDLRGKIIAVGAVDSPQATMIPLMHLYNLGLVPEKDFTVIHFNVMPGKHGDHIGGERDAAVALINGRVDAACMIDSNHLLFSHEGTIPAERTRIIEQTPRYDHCNFTVTDSASSEMVNRFKQLLLGMSYGDPSVRQLLDLEGLKSWKPGRTTGYQLLEKAVDQFGFYDEKGNVKCTNYRY